MARLMMTPERYEEIRRMLNLGVPIREIMRAKRATRRTIRQIRDGLMRSPCEPKEMAGPVWASQVDWDMVGKEALDHPLKYLWEEQASEHVGYKAFLEQFHRKHPQYKKAGVVHRVFTPGDECEVDYAGTLAEWLDVRTGVIHQAPVFLGTLGYSQLIFATARADAKSANFISCHAEMYEAFGGVPKVTVPDCLKTGVIKCHLYDPDLNPSYADMATHYNTAIVPARVRRPKDKAIVEGAVKLVMRYFKWKYRRHTFTSLKEINEALKAVTAHINNKPHTRFKTSRKERWEALERQALGALPEAAYEYAETKLATVHPDSHVQLESNYYSAPHAYRGQKLVVKMTASQVRIFKDLECVAVHRRNSSRKGEYITDNDHLPENAKAYHEATPQSLLSQSKFLSPDLYDLVEGLFKGNALGELRRVQGLIRESRKEINLIGHEPAKENIKKTVETMERFNKVRVTYFKGLLEKYRLEAIDKPSVDTIERKDNPMLRYSGLTLVTNPQKGGENEQHCNH